MAVSFLEAIRYNRGSLQLLDQLLLPNQTSYFDVRNTEEGWLAIKTMQVRGAPAIAISAALALAVELTSNRLQLSTLGPEVVRTTIFEKLEYLKTSRPTAVNLFEAAAKLRMIIESLPSSTTADAIIDTYLSNAEAMLAKDVSDNRSIGEHGAAAIAAAANSGDAPLTIMTICNTGSLATAGWGTALGVIRTLHAKGRLQEAVALETRPYLQGARLTAYELCHDRIPATLICDGAASACMSTRRIHAVVVGADRVVANGDTANKIGTFNLAVAAKYHNVPFFVAAPTTSIDVATATGSDIVIEQRDKQEITHIKGIQITPDDIQVWNPSFDVTPAALITGIITERGVITKQEGQAVFSVAAFLLNK
eukprot:TRINITY_DN15014_c0_g1_i1.p1 TRINITY_DN15014_c0_g1~~TRINITY_DN15014_c0_g1_i1.p1  ORF type:complete len:366 (-),score=73.97 TRINITY_DN15014_c0_g1_i1:182-1279(-)